MAFFYAEIQCENLAAPTNGEIASCSSNKLGVGYEEDHCYLKCNDDYELIGSNIRICQSNGSWSVPDTICRSGTSDMQLHYIFYLVNLYTSSS